ncbi:MAG: hypothetical protein BMS9Abin26_2162 [Gammaproteobacteria bacterium]|nr:MAG: hypothetical protein BMS9Abin26_2162 [Gammaproteobacteria bacterium]
MQNPRDSFGLLLILLTLTPAIGSGAEKSDQGDDPSPELLEFLAEFETKEGDWVDPELLEQMKDAEMGNGATNEQGR